MDVNKTDTHHEPCSPNILAGPIFGVKTTTTTTKHIDSTKSPTVDTATHATFSRPSSPVVAIGPTTTSKPSTPATTKCTPPATVTTTGTGTNRDRLHFDTQPETPRLSPTPLSLRDNDKEGRKKKGSTESNSVDSDEEFADNPMQVTRSFDGTSHEFDPDEQSNGSLSDSMTTQTYRATNGDHSNKYKMNKKKNKLTQMITGVSYKSKAVLFRKLFKNMNANEKLIMDYSCAFYRDILVHGRLYLSKNWLCFYANIIGWETIITVQWADVTAITKEKTAKVIPNAIKVLTDTDKYFFATFVTRDNAYTALFRIWQNALLGHPKTVGELKSECKKYRQKKASDIIDGQPIDYLDETGDEVGEDDMISTNGSTDQLNKVGLDGTSDINDSNSFNNRSHNNSHSTNGYLEEQESAADRVAVDVSTSLNDTSKSDDTNLNARRNGDIDPQDNRKISTKALTKQNLKRNSSHTSPVRTFSKAQDLFKKKKKKHTTHQRGHSLHLIVPPVDPGDTTTDFDEADSDASTEDRIDEEVLCPCHDSHKGTEYTNEEFNFDVDALYDHLFSPESDMMKRVFEERNHMNWKYTPLIKDEAGNDTQTLTYTLNLNYSIGPKTSNTVSKQTFSSDNKPGCFYIITTENRSIGVPYADSFYVSVRYCITRCSGNRSRLKVHGEVVYVKRVFGLVKNMISRSGDEAMKEYYTYLANFLRSESQLIPPTSTSSNKRKPKKLTKKLSKEVIDLQRRKNSQDPSVTQLQLTPVVSLPPTPPPQKNFNLINTTTFGGVVLIILLLLGMNVYLFRRMGSLESSIFVGQRGWLPKDLPKTESEWKELFEYQRSLHDLELIKLKDVLGNTVQLVRQVQESISELYNELEKNINTQKAELSKEKKYKDSEL